MARGPAAVVPTQAALPDYDESGQLKIEPFKILAMRVVARDNQAATQVLVQWTHQDEADATWEFLEQFKKQHPEFQT
ncbi:unnamed protein product [Linum trigynum]|uniref:Chromo domain-containing protein n=1 Tax=Linum trigynum TaxID=586398 RepID=A0AAV2EK14_9ROSI